MKTPLAIVFLYIVVVSYGLSTTIYEHKPDPRVEEWFLMKRWTPIILIISSYFIVVLVGPKLMQNQQPFTLRSMLKCYNAIQVIISAYIFKEFLISAIESRYSLTCQPVDYSNSPVALRMAAACWWFFFSKIIDTFDTVFFILRKKNSQVTFLHVYHHGSMILNWWLGAKYTPGGQVFFQCMINSFVHVIMYTYYFLSAFGPGIQKYLWWKRYLTQLQLIQFCVIIIHLINGMTTAHQCEFPYVFNWYVIVYCVTLIALFTNFYIETYSHQKRDREAALRLKSEKMSNFNETHKKSALEKKPMGVVVNRQPVYCRNDYVTVSSNCRH